MTVINRARTVRSLSVTVIGAGIGGLVSALELASRGASVTVIERGPRPGGKLREVDVGARAIDAGPTVFTMREVFEDVFTLAGSSLTQHLSLTPAPAEPGQACLE